MYFFNKGLIAMMLQLEKNNNIILNSKSYFPIDSPLEERKTELAKHHFGFWPTGLQPGQTHPCQRSCKVAERGAARLLVCYAPHGYLP